MASLTLAPSGPSVVFSYSHRSHARPDAMAEVLKIYALHHAELQLLSDFRVKTVNDKGVSLMLEWEEWRDIAEAVDRLQKSPAPSHLKPHDRTIYSENVLPEKRIKLIVKQFKGKLYTFIRQFDRFGPTRRGFRIIEEDHVINLMEIMKAEANLF